MIIFVFGSNKAGLHGAGAAKDAMEYYGARWGRGIGYQRSVVSLYPLEDKLGNEILFSSYAIPTKDRVFRTLELYPIGMYVNHFVEFAEANPMDDFQVTRVGCGFAGYTDEAMAALFTHAFELPNVHLPLSWINILSLQG